MYEIYSIYTVYSVNVTNEASYVTYERINTKFRLKTAQEWCYRQRYIAYFMKMIFWRCWWQNHCFGDFLAILMIFLILRIDNQYLVLVTNINGLQHRMLHEMYTWYPLLGFTWNSIPGEARYWVFVDYF